MPWVFDITTATVVKASPGTVMTVSVIAAGSTAGTINDATTTGGASVTNQIAVIPMIPDTTNGVMQINAACGSGIVVVPGSGQTLAVFYL